MNLFKYPITILRLIGGPIYKFFFNEIDSPTSTSSIAQPKRTPEQQKEYQQKQKIFKAVEDYYQDHHTKSKFFPRKYSQESSQNFWYYLLLDGLYFDRLVV